MDIFKNIFVVFELSTENTAEFNNADRKLTYGSKTGRQRERIFKIMQATASMECTGKTAEQIANEDGQDQAR